MESFKVIWKNVLCKSKIIILLLILSCSVYAFSIVPIWVQKGYFDRLEQYIGGGYPFNYLLYWLIAFYIARCISGGFLIPAGATKDIYYEYVLTRNVRQSLHQTNNLIRLEYYDSPSMYNLIQRTSSILTTGALRELVNTSGAVLNLIISLVTMLISLWIINYKLVILACISIVPIFVEHYWFDKRMNIIDRQMIESKRKQQQCIIHIIGKEYYLDTRVSGAADYFVESWKNYQKKIEELQNKIHIRQVIFCSISGLIKSLCAIGIFIISIQLFYEKKITVGSFAAVIGIVGMLFAYMDFFISSMSRSIVHINDIKEVTKYFELEKEKRDESSPDTSIGNIRLDHVSFRYENGNRDVVCDVNKIFKKNEKIAVLGINGAGKSTLMNLIMGLYIPTEGHVYYDGIDINTQDKSKWQRRISTIFQDFQTYELSIAENVALGRGTLEYDKDEVINALDEAGVPYQKWDDKEESKIGKLYGGIEMSKGEMQKLAIARYYYNKSADLLVVDEPTAALDPLSEENLYSLLMKKSKDKTTFLVSHRLASVRIADRILVMDNGQIIEDGSHEELIQKNGLYKRMYDEQARLYRR